jgi:hypothetical protein
MLITITGTDENENTVVLTANSDDLVDSVWSLASLVPADNSNPSNDICLDSFLQQNVICPLCGGGLVVSVSAAPAVDSSAPDNSSADQDVVDVSVSSDNTVDANTAPAPDPDPVPAPMIDPNAAPAPDTITPPVADPNVAPAPVVNPAVDPNAQVAVPAPAPVVDPNVIPQTPPVADPNVAPAAQVAPPAPPVAPVAPATN